jgi:YbbR domain-containing protein
MSESKAEQSSPRETPMQNGLQGTAQKPKELTRWSRTVERIGTYILSLVLALVVWLIAINEQNPMVQDDYPVSVPVEVRGPDEGLSPKQDLGDRSVDLVLRAPIRSWEAMDYRSDFTAYVDLTGLPPGSHIVNVEIDQVDPRVDIVDQNPMEFTVELEEVETKVVPVRITVDGEPADGYQMQEAIPSATEASVTGRTSQINQISHVGSTIELDGSERSQVETELPLQAISSQNLPVPGVTIEPVEVSVVLPIDQTPGRKEVAVRPDLEGEPATGYRLSSLRVEPSSVTLIGDPDILVNVPGSVETSVFSLDDATADFTRPVELLLPEGVTTADGRNTVIVSATITAIESGKTITLSPIIDGLGANETADVALEAVDVIISGPVSLLESLEADDMFVILDLSGLAPGVHNVRPQVVLPTGVKMEAVIPETVEVLIAETAEFESEATTEAQEATPAATVTPDDEP